MAQRRIRYRRTKKPEQFEPEALYANFIGDLLEGTVTANKIIEGHGQGGNRVIDYDDPTGVGQSIAQSQNKAR